MVLQVLGIILIAAAQTDALYAGPVPAEVPTFEVTIGNTPPFFAALQIDGYWVSDHSTEIKPNLVVDFVPDGPGYVGEPSRTLMRNAKVVYEPPAMRRKRLEEMWDALGYTFLETTSGWRRIREEDLHLAERARRMAEAAAKGAASFASEGLAANHNSPGTGPTAPGRPVTAWLYRTGILLITIILLWLIYFLGTRRTRPWQRLQ
ncbi:MAG: hypothetical protein BWX80_01828 [Candidatus Hydrogenedentes bacterium ADurb.Bin101]|nr:hypothetical protein [Candidatus Hydrogenedentota bacterium]OQC05894.1 MAG: hypothetical protein BWX80_01828 [Candidatus Hydrogenedentes bacterium ADurb.Bin101]HOC68899.1 hypothetical protein [Candidatus Hydrogenedentota bacterium]